MNTYTLQRFLEDQYGTHGAIIDGSGKAILRTIEQPWRNNHPWTGNPATVSCIAPGGPYLCTPHDTPKHPRCWQINCGGGRFDVLIHTGNTEKDTEGCVIVGTIATDEGVLDSQIGLEKLRRIEGWPSTFQLVIKAVPNDNNMTT